MGIYKRLTLRELFGDQVPQQPPRVASRAFSGKDEGGRPLREGHRHAYFLPADEDGDGRLDHVTVYAAGGFEPRVS